MAADGYTYERVAIEQWLATGAGTSPKMPRTVNGTGHTGPSEFCATSI